MIEVSNVPVSLDAMLPAGEALLRRELARALGVKADQLGEVRLVKRSVDARKKGNVHFVATFAVGLAQGVEASPVRGVNVRAHKPAPALDVPDCAAAFARSGEVRPVVVGTGPAGLFAALYLARAGLRPLVVERGAAVEQRVEAIAAFNAGGSLDPSTNIQFGEGGAGTFSDGKLNTGTKSPHIRHVLEQFVAAGAPEDILVAAKPHIGTDKLVDVVRNLRRAIIAAGGEVRFNTQLVGFEFAEAPCALGAEDEAIAVSRAFVAEGEAAAPPRTAEAPDAAAPHVAVPRALEAVWLLDAETDARERIAATRVVLACGHSARDTFSLVRDAGARMERKPFSVGVRIEHPQPLIDELQYGAAAGHPALGAADYKLAVHTKGGRGVYTFCMCPGGEVVAAASEEGGVCVNGMSRYARDGDNANSALLVGIEPDDFPDGDALAGVEFQRSIECAAFRLGASRGGAPYTAPVQTVGDFLSGGCGNESNLVTPTYPRGVVWTDLHECLPPFVTDALAEGLALLDRKLKGFAHPQAVMTGVEARSSSPVRMVRGADFQAEGVRGLYPCGEGAGYAGGITSAAVDGLRVAEAIAAEFA